MMEFTVNGVVRQSFGFYNPNHAAALICILIPLCWGWRKGRLAGYCLSLLLLVPLSMTFSRTGLAVLAFECGAYLFLVRRCSWKMVLAFAVCGILAFAIAGISSRFALDKAVANRPQIWLAGLKLSAANPLGVGFGNSGRIATAFLLDGIDVRTLVNSHLTLLCECGLPVAFAWSLFIMSALVKGIRRPEAWSAFAGMCVSAFSSSVFDWHVLFDFHGFGGLTVMNFILSWLSFLLFLALGIWLCIGRIAKRHVLAALSMSTAVCLLPFVFYSDSTPICRDGYVFLNENGGEKALYLYDSAWELKDIRRFVSQSECSIISLESSESTALEALPKADSVMLFGECAGMAPLFPTEKLTFVSPPEYAELPKNTKRIFLKRYIEEREVEGIEVVYY